MTEQERLADCYACWEYAIAWKREQLIRSGREKPVLGHEYQWAPKRENSE